MISTGRACWRARSRCALPGASATIAPLGAIYGVRECAPGSRSLRTTTASAGAAATSSVERLVHDAASLGVALAEHDAARLLQLLDELERWNRTYNRSEEHTSELQSRLHLVCRLLL